MSLDADKIWASLSDYVFGKTTALTDSEKTLWSVTLNAKNVLNVPVPSMMLNGKLILEESGFLDKASAGDDDDEEGEGAMA